MKRVLWVSRHEMTRDQRADLEQALGGPVELILWRDTVADAAQLLPALDGADAVAAVLPVELLARLLPLAGERPVLVATSGREATGQVRTLPDGRRDPEFAFVHQGWRQILRLELETRLL